MKNYLSKAALLAALMPLGANAANLPLPTGTFLLSDNSAEQLVNCTPGAAGCDSTAGDTTVDIGDTLTGIFVIDDVSGTSILAGSGYDELSGVFSATVVDKFDNGSGLISYEFAPTASFEATYGAGAMVAYFTDPVHEYVRESAGGALSATDMENRVTDGALWMVTGILGANNYWYGRSELTDDVNFPLAPPNTDVGDYAFALDIITNNSGREFAAVNCATPLSFPFTGAPASVTADQCGIGNILTPNPAAGNSTPFDVWNDQNINMESIPEPTSIALLGIGILGLALSGKKRSRMTA